MVYVCVYVYVNVELQLLQFILNVIVAHKDLLVGQWIAVAVFLVSFSLCTGEYFQFEHTIDPQQSHVYYRYVHCTALGFHSFPEYFGDCLLSKKKKFFIDTNIC